MTNTTATQALAAKLVGTKVHNLPDCGTITVQSVTDGFECGESVIYVSGVNSLGQTISRWVRPGRAIR